MVSIVSKSLRLVGGAVLVALPPSGIAHGLLLKSSTAATPNSGPSDDEILACHDCTGVSTVIQTATRKLWSLWAWKLVGAGNFGTVYEFGGERSDAEEEFLKEVPEEYKEYVGGVENFVVKVTSKTDFCNGSEAEFLFGEDVWREHCGFHSSPAAKMMSADPPSLRKNLKSVKGDRHMLRPITFLDGDITSWSGRANSTGKKTSIILERVGDMSLREWQQRQQQPSSKDVVAILSGVVEDLRKLQSLGVQHNDLKPDNVRVSRNGKESFLVDFGLSGPKWVLGQGSEKYMAPELKAAEIKGPHSGEEGEADAYALGIMGLELLWKGTTLLQTHLDLYMDSKNTREIARVLNHLKSEIAPDDYTFLAAKFFLWCTGIDVGDDCERTSLSKCNFSTSPTPLRKWEHVMQKWNTLSKKLETKK
jgi:serine/threonine protein kinase